MYHIRPLTTADIPRLTEINPTFSSETVLRVERLDEGIFRGWRLREDRLATPFHKKRGYDFDKIEQQNIRERLARDNGLFEVVERAQDGRLVGILDVQEESWRQTAWIWNVMLDISVRGQGLGRELMGRAEAWARKRKLRAIMLETQSNNVPACRFYAALGFKLIGINDVYYTNTDIQDNEVALFWGYPLE